MYRFTVIDSSLIDYEIKIFEKQGVPEGRGLIDGSICATFNRAEVSPNCYEIPF